MILRDQSILNDPRAGQVSTTIHELIQPVSSLRSDEEIYEAVADAISMTLEFDRLSIVLTQGDIAVMLPVFLRGAPIDHTIVLRRSDPLVVRAMTARNTFLHNIGDGSFDTPAEDERIRQGFKQVAVSPVIIDDQNFGALNISSKKEGLYSERDLWIVETISNTLGLMLAGSKLRREAQERARDAELLLELGHLMLSTLEPSEVLRHAAERIGATVNCDVLIIHHHDGTWSGEEPFVRDASQLRSRRTLLDRISSIQPPVQPHLRHPGLSARDSSDMTQALVDLISRIDELLESEDIYRSLISPGTSETGDPLILVALRSHHGDREFSEEDRAMIGQILRYVCPALVNATLNHYLTRALHVREAVHRMATAIGSGKSTLDRTMIACRTAQLLFACDYVALTDWSTQPPNLRYVIGSNTTEPLTLSRAGTVTAVRRSGDVRIINDFPSDPPVKVAWYPLHVAEGLRASLTFRLQWSGKTFGSLILGLRRPRHFSETDLRFAESMANAVVASLGPELHLGGLLR